MKHNEEMILGPRSAKLYTQKWLPDQESKASIVICHGLAEHSSRYQYVAEYLVNRGYAVYAIDHLGHGKSDGQRCVIESFGDFLQPLHRLVLATKAEQSRKPIFMLGHSMGGLLTSLYLLEHQEELSGAMLSAPVVMTTTTPSAFQSFLIRQFNRFLPRMGVLQMDASEVCSDPGVVADYQNDPLVFSGKVSARLVYELGRGARMLVENMKKITLPILILQGGKDVMVNPKGAQLLFDGIGSKEKNLKMFDECYHEILNEPNYKDEILEIISEWLDKTSKSRD